MAEAPIEVEGVEEELDAAWSRGGVEQESSRADRAEAGDDERRGFETARGQPHRGRVPDVSRSENANQLVRLEHRASDQGETQGTERDGSVGGSARRRDETRRECTRRRARCTRSECRCSGGPRAGLGQNMGGPSRDLGDGPPSSVVDRRDHRVSQAGQQGHEAAGGCISSPPQPALGGGTRDGGLDRGAPGVAVAACGDGLGRDDASERAGLDCDVEEPPAAEHGEHAEGAVLLEDDRGQRHQALRPLDEDR